MKTSNTDVHQPNGKRISRRIFVAGAFASVCAQLLTNSAQAKVLKNKQKKKKTKKLKEFKLVYHLANGKNPADQIKRVVEGKFVLLKDLKIPTRRGYDFVGWYTNKERTEQRSKLKGVKDKLKRSIWAKWKIITYSIGYTLDDDVSTSNLKTSYTISSKTQSLPKAKRAGYAFLYWSRKKYPSEAFSKIPANKIGNLHLIANWENYWADYMNTQCVVAKALHDRCDDSFFFITDVHIPSNQMVAPRLIEQIQQASGIEMVVCGGDLINANQATQETSIATINTWKSAMSFTTVFHVRGNHDMNDQDIETYAFSNEQYYELFLSNETFALKIADSVSSEKFYYYRDNEDASIRYLFLDTGHNTQEGYMDDEQLAWMQERILELETGWIVIIFAHIFFRGTRLSKYLLGTGDECFTTSVGSQIKCALDEIYDDANATIAAIISGHTHKSYAVLAGEYLMVQTDIDDDSSWEKSYCSYPIISTTADALGKRKGVDTSNLNDFVTLWADDAGTKKTTSEQAFEVYGIDKDACTITIQRIGAGAGRKFIYEAKSTDSSDSSDSGSSDSSDSSDSGSSDSSDSSDSTDSSDSSDSGSSDSSDSSDSGSSDSSDSSDSTDSSDSSDSL